MRSVKLLLLPSLLFCAAIAKVQSFEVKIEGFSGTLAEDSLNLPRQTRRLGIRWIGSNQTADIETGAICTASALRTVEINFVQTKFPILREDMFKNCENLTELVIYGNLKHPTELQGGVFRNFLKMKSLQVHYLKIHRLERNLFAGMNSLSDLSLCVCEIREIEPGAFDGLKNLETLSLESNIITVLPMILFKDLQRIRKINLARNQISQINWDEFDGSLPSLEGLELRSNRLTSLDPDAIAKYMPALKYLSVQHNTMNCTTKENFAQQLRKKLDHPVSVSYFDLVYFDYGANCELEERYFAQHKLPDGVEYY